MKNNPASFVAVLLITALVITSGCTTVDQQTVDDSDSATVGAIQSQSVTVEATPLSIDTAVLPSPTVDLGMVNEAVAPTISVLPTATARPTSRPTTPPAPTEVLPPTLTPTATQVPMAAPSDTPVPSATPMPTVIHVSTPVPSPTPTATATPLPKIDLASGTTVRFIESQSQLPLGWQLKDAGYFATGWQMIEAVHTNRYDFAVNLTITLKITDREGFPLNQSGRFIFRCVQPNQSAREYSTVQRSGDDSRIFNWQILSQSRCRESVSDSWEHLSGIIRFPDTPPEFVTEFTNAGTVAERKSNAIPDVRFEVIESTAVNPTNYTMITYDESEVQIRYQGGVPPFNGRHVRSPGKYLNEMGQYCETGVSLSPIEARTYSGVPKLKTTCSFRFSIVDEEIARFNWTLDDNPDEYAFCTQNTYRNKRCRAQPLMPRQMIPTPTAISSVDEIAVSGQTKTRELGNPSVEGINPSIAIGTSGQVAISYYDQIARQLRVFSCESISCEVISDRLVAQSVDIGINSTIFFDSGGFPSLVHNGASKHQLVLTRCSDANCNEFESRVLDTAKNVGTNNSVVYSEDMFAISYVDTGLNALKISVCTGDHCGNPTNVWTYFGTELASTKIINNRDNRLSVFLVDDHKLVYVRCIDPICQFTESHNFDGLERVGESVDGFITSGGNPIAIVYLEEGKDLAWIECLDAECSVWEQHAIDATGQVGRDFDLVEISDDWVGISYLDLSDQSLNVTLCQVKLCDQQAIYRVDSGSLSGRSNAIADDGFGNFLIAHHNDGNSRLLLTLCEADICQIQ